MTTLNLETINAPNNVKDSLKSLSQQYSFNKFSPKGANGFLFFATDNILKRKVAVKYYYWSGDPKYHAEPRRLSKVNSPNVLKIFNAELIDGDMAFFVTEFCKNGDLDDYISKSPLGLKRAVDLTINVLSGLSTLHSSRYLHRDLKPQNIFINSKHQALIGDFGSVRFLPEGTIHVPASSHAILYRPPESCQINKYGFEGDVYQVGIVLYQLLGGYLPYDELAWLTTSKLKKYEDLGNPIDKSIYVDEVITEKISRGKLLDFNTLPPWVPSSLKRIIKKATNIAPDKRFPTSSSFIVALNSIRASLKDWDFELGRPVLRGKTSYKICKSGNDEFFVEKKRDGSWRRDNTFSKMSFEEIVKKIEE